MINKEYIVTHFNFRKKRQNLTKPILLFLCKRDICAKLQRGQDSVVGIIFAYKVEVT